MDCQQCNGSGQIHTTYRECHRGRNYWIDSAVNCHVCGGTGQAPLEAPTDPATFGEAIKHDSLFSLFIRFNDGQEPYYTETQAQYGMGALRHWTALPNVDQVSWVVVSGGSRYAGNVAGAAAQVIQLPTIEAPSDVEELAA